MRIHPIPLIAALFLCPLISAAQNDSRFSLLLKSGPVIPTPNISPEKINEFNQKSNKAGGKTFAIIQFEKIPSEEQKRELKNQGIELLEYVPHNAYTVIISGAPTADILLQFQVRSLIGLSPRQKTDPELSKKLTGTASVWISFPTS